MAGKRPSGAWKSAAEAAGAAALGLALVAGCKSAQDWRRQADERSKANLEAAQMEVSGRTEPLVIETPAETLRRRLLLDQGLAVSDLASLGIRDLPEDRYWQPGKRLLDGTEGEQPGVRESVGTNALEIGLLDAVRIAAYNSREYQANKETLYQAALALDLEDNEFRSIFSSLVSADASAFRSGNSRTGSHGEGADLGLSRKFSNGIRFTGAIAVNLAGMLTGDRATAWGSLADTSVSIPLMRGSGTLVNTESLTQAQRNLLYAVRSFEQKKREFAVSISGSYLSLLLAKRRRQNEDDNYKRVIVSTRRSRRMADASRLSQSDFDQSHQSELSARASWISACQNYESTLDGFKMTLGLPPDARVTPRDADLASLQEYVEKFAKTELGEYDMGEKGKPLVLEAPDSVDEGAMKLETDRAIAVAFTNRSDFVSYRDRIEDAQRKLLVAEDRLRAEVTLGGSASALEKASSGLGRTGADHASLNLNKWNGNAFLNIDLPLERTAERNAYRNALVSMEQAVRAYQAEEDSLKRAIRQDMRQLSQTREQLKIQFVAVQLAERRVRNQDLLMQAGRADMTVVLDSQAALVSAQNALYAAITSYRGQELELQRDLGLLDVTVDGTWREADLSAIGVRSRAP